MSAGLPRRRIGRTGLEVTVLGLGCAALGNLYQRVEPDAAAATLLAAWDGGVRYFDTAPYYGHGLSETRLGEFLRGPPADTMVISTKVGRSLVPVAPGDEGDFGFADPLPNRPVFDYSSDAVRAQVEGSLTRLGVTRFGMLLVHDIGAMTHGDAHPAIFRQAMDGALPALRKMKDEGLVSAIGIGVNEIAVSLATVRAADIDVVLLAGRYTLLEQAALAELLPECDARGVSVVVGGPFNSGALAGGDHYDYAAMPPAVAERVACLAAVCRRFDVPLPAAALQFPLAHPAVAAVIPGARSPAEVQANLAHLARPIPGDLYQALKAENLLVPEAPTP